MADWCTRLLERKQRGEAEWDRLAHGRIKHPTEDRYMTYGEYKQQRRAIRRERNRQRTANVLTKLHMYHPHYLKHPTEDREVTWGEWKQAQIAFIEEQRRLYIKMRWEHNLIIRAMIWISHPEQHVNFLDRRRMQRTGESVESLLARKADCYAATRLIRRTPAWQALRAQRRETIGPSRFWLTVFWMNDVGNATNAILLYLPRKAVRAAAPRIKTFLNHARNSLRKR